jgi:hypothetical protein
MYLPFLNQIPLTSAESKTEIVRHFQKIEKGLKFLTPFSIIMFSITQIRANVKKKKKHEKSSQFI